MSSLPAAANSRGHAFLVSCRRKGRLLFTACGHADVLLRCKRWANPFLEQVVEVTGSVATATIHPGEAPRAYARV